jgi:hypothetical protein
MMNFKFHLILFIIACSAFQTFSVGFILQRTERTEAHSTLNDTTSSQFISYDHHIFRKLQVQPSSQPSRQPSCQPSIQPTRQPTVQPSSQPTRQPTGQPSQQPTTQPTGRFVSTGFGSCMFAPQVLTPGSCLFSPSNRYKFCFSNDGSTCIKKFSGSLWCVYNAFANPSVLSLQSDQNLVLYDTNGLAKWNTVTSVNSKPNMAQAFLAIQDNGNLVLFNTSLSPPIRIIWQCATLGTNPCPTNGLITALTQGELCSNQPTSQPTGQPSGQPTFRIAPTSLKNGLLAYYPFDGNAHDNSENNHHGVVHSAVLTTDRFGNPNSAYSFNGQNAYIEVFDGLSFNFYSNFTLSVWIKPKSSQNDFANIFDKSHVSGTGFALQQSSSDDNYFHFIYYSSENVPQARLIPVSANKWNHYVFIKQEKILKIYLDSILSDTFLAPTSAMISSRYPNYPLLIGAMNALETKPASGLNRFFNGSLDEILFYNRSLSADEVLLLYDFDSPTSQPSRQPSNQPTSQPSVQPSGKPSRQPSARPTNQPTGVPTSQPSSHPFSIPTAQPSRRPSNQPSSQPSRDPSSQPTGQPTRRPSIQPSSHPTSRPSQQPSCHPTDQPSSCPSLQPSTRPSSRPSCLPSTKPSNQPSLQPTGRPSSQPTMYPTAQPSSAPTNSPTAIPSFQPSTRPSGKPTMIPSIQPTSQPSVFPSSQPSVLPSSAPSNQPSGFPSSQPSSVPTIQPSSAPSIQPSGNPTIQPTSVPSTQPSNQPIGQPSAFPTSHPSKIPSSQPTAMPSKQPTTQPTSIPSCQPTSMPSLHPSCNPTSQPTSVPSNQPTGPPSCRPTNQPTSHPSSQPSIKPSSQPTSEPSLQPTVIPTVQPSQQPSNHPTSYPTGQPSSAPSCQPTAIPSNQPSGLPTDQPSSFPTDQPSRQPSRAPSDQPSSSPTSRPSIQPTTIPTDQPVAFPTSAPQATIYQTYGVLFYLGAMSGAVRNNDFLGTSYILFGRNFKHQTRFPSTISLDSSLSREFVSPIISNEAGIRNDVTIRSTTVIGDINGDSYLDLLIGYPLVSKCSVYLGDGVNDFATIITTTGESFAIIGDPYRGSGFLGWSSIRIGDLNGDGLEEIVVSAINANTVFVIYGRTRFYKTITITELTYKDGFQIKGSDQETNFGVGLSLLHHFRKGSHADIAVTSQRSTAGQCVVYVLFGGVLFRNPENIINIDRIVNNPNACLTIFAPLYSFAGFSVAGVGDLNSDGYDDLAIGSVPYYRGKHREQKTYIIYGRKFEEEHELDLAQMTSDDGFIIAGGGFLVTGVGDVNGDGVADVMISSYSDWKGQRSAYLISTPSNMTYSPSFQPSSTPTMSSTGVPNTFLVNSTISRIRSPTLIPSFRPSYPSTLVPTRGVFAIGTSRPSTSHPSLAPSLTPTSGYHRLRGFPTIAPALQPTVMPTINTTFFTEVDCFNEIEYQGKNGSHYLFRITTNTGIVTLRGNDEGGAKNIYVLYCPRERVNVVIQNFRIATDIISVAHLIKAGYSYPSLNEIPYSSKSGPLTMLFCSENKLQVILSSHNSFDLGKGNFLFTQMHENNLNQGDKKNTILARVQIGIVFAVLLFLVAVFLALSYEEKRKLKNEERWLKSLTIWSEELPGNHSDQNVEENQQSRHDSVSSNPAGVVIINNRQENKQLSSDLSSSSSSSSSSRYSFEVNLNHQSQSDDVISIGSINSDDWQDFLVPSDDDKDDEQQLQGQSALTCDNPVLLLDEMVQNNLSPRGSSSSALSSEEGYQLPSEVSFTIFPVMKEKDNTIIDAISSINSDEWQGALDLSDDDDES